MLPAFERDVSGSRLKRLAVAALPARPMTSAVRMRGPLTGRHGLRSSRRKVMRTVEYGSQRAEARRGQRPPGIYPSLDNTAVFGFTLHEHVNECAGPVTMPC